MRISKPPSATAAAAMFRPATSSRFSFELGASQWAVKGLLNDEFRAASKIELNMVSPLNEFKANLVEVESKG